MVLAVYAVVRIISALWPRPKFFKLFLEYPRQDVLAAIEPGELTSLEVDKPAGVIRVFRQGSRFEEDLLGQLPARYFGLMEPRLRKGEVYRAIVVEHTGGNIELEINFGERALPDEFV